MIKYKDALKILSPREVEVLDLVVLGFTSKEIGLKLNLSRFTVENHIKNIKLKLNLKGQRSLFQWYQEYCSN